MLNCNQLILNDNSFIDESSLAHRYIGRENVEKCTLKKAALGEAVMDVAALAAWKCRRTS